MAKNATIAALATAPGKAAIAIIRISGPNAWPATKAIFSGPKAMQPHRLYLGWLHDGPDKFDQALVVYMPSPNSFTGENLVEIQCHGSMLIVEKTLQALFKQAVVPAKPGEFSKRAFLNDKLNLNQAEAVMQLVNSEHQHLSRLATRQLAGEFSKQIEKIKTELIRLIAGLSADLDFSEEDLPDIPDKNIIASLKKIYHSIANLSVETKQIRFYDKHPEIVLVGLPNAGKSTLLNTLLGYDRVLVSKQAGTTRDSVSEIIEISGLSVKLIDTAGLNRSAGGIEKEGINKSLQHLKSADAILLLVEPGKLVETLNLFEKLGITKLLKKPSTLIIFTKSDLGRIETKSGYNLINTVRVSSKNRTGLKDLRQKLADILSTQGSSQLPQAITQRQNTLLKSSLTQINKIIKQSKLPPKDILVVELSSILSELNELTGEQVSQQVVDKIFSSFCIGK